MITIKFGVFHILSDNIYENVIMKYKSYNVRPFAFIFDSYVFSWFWDNMYALLLLMLIMHVANLFLVYKICEKIDIKLNGFCLTLFALSPILVEALYWISASTRIVFSLFLCLASIYLLLNSFEVENKAKKSTILLGGIFLNLVCVGFYEQTIALNLFLFVFVLVCLKKYKYMFIPILSTTWIGVWYLYFMLNGEMQTRGALNLSGMFSRAVSCMKMVWINFRNGFLNFLYSLELNKEVILSSLFSLVILAIFIGFIYYIYKNNCNEICNKKVIRKSIFAIIFVVAPILPFIVLNTEYIAVRNLYFTTFGLAVFVEIIFDFVIGFIKNEKVCNVLKTGILAYVCFFYIISNIDGVNNFRKVNLLDNKVVSQILEIVDEEAIISEKSISINYDTNELTKYKNLSHTIISIIEVDWALLGKIQVVREDINLPKVYINSRQNDADYVFYFDENMNLIQN